MVFAWDTTTGVAKTGDAANITAYVSKDYAAVTVLGDTSATEMDATNAKGYYLFDAAQGETNADCLMVSAKSSTANIAVIGAPAVIYTRPTTGWLAPTTAGRTLDVSAGGEAGVDWANVGSPTTSLALTGTTIATTQKVDLETIKTNPVVNGGTLTFPSGATLASTTNITAGTVTTATNVTTVNGLAANVITAASIATGAIDADAIADGAIDAGALAADCITAAKIANGAIDAATFAAGAIDAAALAADAGTEIGTAVWASATRTLTAGTNVDGSTFTAIPWNAAWDAEVQSEVDDALVAQNLDHLIKIAVDTNFATTVHADSVIGQIADNGAGFDRTTDSLEAIRDNMGTAQTGDAYAIVNSGTHGNAALKTLIDTVDDLLDTEVAAIKTQTDKLTFTVANQIDANIQYVNDVAVTGNGQSGTEWGPA